MLSVENLNAGYGKLQILFDINIEVRDRDFVVIVGPNGSGKSTLLKAIFGLATIYSGRVALDGIDITKMPPNKKARMGIAYLPQLDNVFTNLTVEENLKMAGYAVEKDQLNDRIEEALSIFPNLKRFLRRKAGTLSGGERQMLAMAMALIRRPKLMMFDEPTAQLAPKIAAELFAKIRELRDQHGKTIILVEQNAKKALEIGDRAYLLVSGRVAYEGDAQQLLTHPELGKLYLGLK
jgi:branched-chain amino acid transport system ATP-binding protein